MSTEKEKKAKAGRQTGHAWDRSVQGKGRLSGLDQVTGTG